MAERVAAMAEADVQRARKNAKWAWSILAMLILVICIGGGYGTWPLAIAHLEAKRLRDTVADSKTRLQSMQAQSDALDRQLREMVTDKVSVQAQLDEKAQEATRMATERNKLWNDLAIAI